MSSSLSAARIAQKHPDIHARATFRPSRANVVRLGLAGFVVGGIILLAGLGADWRPYALIGGWGVVGIFYWLLAARGRERAVAET
jgi:APA family basic amino acid/polyamine antiporter